MVFFREVHQAKINNIDLDTDEYVNLIDIHESSLKLSYIDSINVFWILFMLFYYTSNLHESLKTYAQFFSNMMSYAWEISFLFCFFIGVFSVALFVYFDQRVEEWNNFSGLVVNAFSLASGGRFIKEDEDIFREHGTGFFYLVNFES
jgi:hypothetical protein